MSKADSAYESYRTVVAKDEKATGGIRSSLHTA